MDSRNEPGPVRSLHPAGATPLDIAAGAMLGVEPFDPVPKDSEYDTVDQAFEAVVLPALQSDHCLVSFAGGRDSSWMLVLTTQVARKHGLPDPVPVTMQLKAGEMAEEAAWQEVLIRSLGLKDWERFDIEHEFNLVGPIAQTALRRHGHIFPAGAFMTLPMLERARGGTLIVAQGTDQLFVFWRWARLFDLLCLRDRPRRSHAKLVATALMPAALRRKFFMRAAPRAPLPWLREDAALEVSRIFASEVGTEPIRFDRAVSGLLRHRCVAATGRSMRALADGVGTPLVMPGLDKRFQAATAREGGWSGWGDRDTTYRKLAGHLLPDEVLTRRDRPRFNELFFGPHTRAFAERWSGGGVDPSLVDPDMLRGMWLSDDQHDFRTALLMHAAWLHDEHQATPQGRSSHGQEAPAATA